MAEQLNCPHGYRGGSFCPEHCYALNGVWKLDERFTCGLCGKEHATGIALYQHQCSADDAEAKLRS